MWVTSVHLYVCVCVHVSKKKKKKTLEVIRDYGSLSVCLNHTSTRAKTQRHTHTCPHTQWHTHTVFPWRPSSSAIFPSDYTFHLLIFILICFSQTREGVKGVIGERDGGGQMGEGGWAWSAEKERIWGRDYEIFVLILSNCRCPSYPQAKKNRLTKLMIRIVHKNGPLPRCSIINVNLFLHLFN